MSPANKQKVGELREELQNSGIVFDASVLDIGVESYSSRVLEARYENRKAIRRQLEERGISEVEIDAIISRIHGDTWKEVGYYSRIPVTAEGACKRAERALRILGKEREG